MGSTPLLPRQIAPAPSALQNLINNHTFQNKDQDKSHLTNLALQVSHNLRYQHNWTELQIHHSAKHSQTHSLPRPLISGIPPKRLYIHPDEQIALLQSQKDQGGKGLPELKPEREWVLPTGLRERWTLRAFGEIFGGIGKVPGKGEGESVFEDENEDEGSEVHVVSEGIHPDETNEWRTKQPKRLLLAVVDDDSTVVYYIVHDGVVKPRQN